MSKFKKPTKKEIQRIADLFVAYQSPDKNHQFLYRLYIALDTRLHKKACIETVLSEFFGLDPF